MSRGFRIADEDEISGNMARLTDNLRESMIDDGSYPWDEWDTFRDWTYYGEENNDEYADIERKSVVLLTRWRGRNWFRIFAANKTKNAKTTTSNFGFVQTISD